MKREYFTTANEKFQKGDPLTDLEVQRLQKFYRELHKSISMLDRDFNLAKAEVVRRYTTLDSYRHARGLAELL